MSITVFVCGGLKPPPCSVPGCGGVKATNCEFELKGVLRQQACGRPLCTAHSAVVAMHCSDAYPAVNVVVCPPHQRLIRQQHHAEKGTRE